MADRVAVLVPVMRRPHNAEPFMASLRRPGPGRGTATTNRAKVYAVADAGDIATIAAWRAAGAAVLAVATDRPGTFPEKINVGYRDTSQPWLFLVGDDVRFHRGWLDEALRVADESGACVIGTNDLGNARVMAGEHATHMLVRRSYVDEQGASWDGPGVVCHEQYRHWYCDEELVTVAKQRGVWAAAPTAIVEHLHPLWGKADVDGVYELGAAHATVDAALFARRAAAHAH